MTDLTLIGNKAKEASFKLAQLSSAQKDVALFKIAEFLRENTEEILKANVSDIAAAEKKGISGAFIERLTLNPARIEAMAKGAEEVAALPDPTAKLDGGMTRPNGLRIEIRRVPLGVVGIIFESRPNVTVDAACLCLKSGNSCILRGGSEAIESNTALCRIMRRALQAAGVTEDAVALIEDTSRETASRFMALKALDVLIPRGGAGLISAVVEQAKVPVIETGVGNCHVYVDDHADLCMADRIVENAKASRPSVCNAAETLLVAESVAERFLPMMKKSLDKYSMEYRLCEKSAAVISGTPATEDDWSCEYNDYILAVKVVSGIDEAIAHINRYGTRHSEAIVTENYANAQRFLAEVDAAAVYVNASTRFTDGGEFGFGAEIGISTQKLHARGPMGLAQLTTVKYVVYGGGQIR